MGLWYYQEQVHPLSYGHYGSALEHGFNEAVWPLGSMAGFVSFLFFSILFFSFCLVIACLLIPGVAVGTAAAQSPVRAARWPCGRRVPPAWLPVPAARLPAASVGDGYGATAQAPRPPAACCGRTTCYRIIAISDSSRYRHAINSFNDAFI